MIFLDLINWCWVIWVAFWILAALKSKPVAERQSAPLEIGHRIFIVIAFWLLFFQDILAQRQHTAHTFNLTIPLFAQRIITQTPHIQLIGFIFTISGLLLALWARITLGSNWSSTVTFKKKHELVQQGPYALVRHPIYAAILLMFLGTALAYGTLGGLLSLPFLFISFWIKLRQEETLMLKHFSVDYPEYQKRVKRLIPFIF